MNRRVFLKFTGLLAVAGTVEALSVAGVRRSVPMQSARSQNVAQASKPSTMQLTMHEPGTYRITGVVRLNEPLVEISGITDTQWISWSGGNGLERQMSSFTTFEHFDRPGQTRTIQVRGGQLETVTAVPMDYA